MKNLVIILGILLAITSCSKKAEKVTQKKSNVLMTKREFPISKNYKPCDDFYKYACDEVISNFKLRPDRSGHTFAFHDSYDRILEHKKNYLSNLLSKSNHSERSKQLKNYYASCMDQDSRAKEERLFVKEKLKELRSMETKQEFLDYLIDRALEGRVSFIRFFNDANLDDPNKYDFLLLPTKMMNLPERSYYKNFELVRSYQEVILDFFKQTNVSDPLAKTGMVVQVEKWFADAYPLPAEQRKRWSLRKYSTKADLLKFKSLNLKRLLDKVPDTVKIRNPMNDVLIFLNKLFEESTLEQLQTFYFYHSMLNVLDEGYKDFYKKKFEFRHKFLGGPETRTVLNERCAQDMRRFNKEIDAELFDTIFPNFDEEKFVKTLQRVKESIVEGLEKNTWLSKKSKEGAIKKIKLAKFQVVKPKTEEEWDFNPKANYNPKTYIGNKQLLNKKLVQRRFERLPKQVNRDKWYMGPLTVNAYYDPSNNKFVMPAGILQYPFYDPELEEWQNLGAVGAVVGHELGHGMDDQGAKYDAYGKLNQWMSDEDIKKFQERGKKLISHFDKAGHNGELTLGENIGDLVGLTFAHKAALKVMPRNGEARLQAQREFYTQYARAWCGKMRPKMEERRLKTGPHSLGWARVNEQVKHQESFEKAFSCKPGDKMVLPNDQRVKIW
jgi:putative endopeptidase